MVNLSKKLRSFISYLVFGAFFLLMMPIAMIANLFTRKRVGSTVSRLDKLLDETDEVITLDER
ncbi:MAG: hypothetical protein HY456_01050 [Parcubacteria group bacterium]|nr:hypothetical protein [Parcubacteria group bacterium]